MSNQESPIDLIGDAFAQDAPNVKNPTPKRFPWFRVYLFTTYVIVLWQACFEGFNWAYWYMQEIVVRRIG